ncbi:MAG TPA: DmsE family decaheme c-type cytochrome [Vicinamibacteria bacterium]|nr:DmsE family decaheme c-type cytochrome [Vicinamibacteria bacterium]
MKTRGGWVLAAAAVGLVALAAAPAMAQEECATCHEEVAKGFGKTGHGRSFAADKNYQTASCTSCHTGAQEHLDSGGEKRPASLTKGAADEANASCLSCHAGKNQQAHWQGSAHQRAGTRCASCHDVHGKHPGSAEPARALPAATESTKKCLECHGAMRASLHQRSAHPMREGQMQCVSCHNPHGTAGEKLINHGSTNELCYSCHQNLRGPFLWEHSPVREDCLTCHRAHGSNYPSLLQARVTQLCQSCHQQGRHQTLPGVPASVWVGNKACLNCHSQIHGSNHPSGPLFQR